MGGAVSTSITVTVHKLIHVCSIIYQPLQAAGALIENGGVHENLAVFSNTHYYSAGSTKCRMPWNQAKHNPRMCGNATG